MPVGVPKPCAQVFSDIAPSPEGVAIETPDGDHLRTNLASGYDLSMVRVPLACDGQGYVVAVAPVHDLNLQGTRRVNSTDRTALIQTARHHQFNSIYVLSMQR